MSTCKFLFSGVQTYPVNPYLKWLGVVGKVKWHGLEHGLVRYRILYYDAGSFLPCPAPVQSLPFPSGVLRGAEHKIVLGHVLVPFLGFHYASSAIALLGSGLGPKRRMGLGHELSGPTHNIKLLYSFVLFYNNWFRFLLHTHTFISQSDRGNKQVHSLFFFLYLYLNLWFLLMY